MGLRHKPLVHYYLISWAITDDKCVTGYIDSLTLLPFIDLLTRTNLLVVTMYIYISRRPKNNNYYIYHDILPAYNIAQFLQLLADMN